MQDPILKKIFAIPTMVELLARKYRSDLASRIDFSTLTELPNELLSEQLDKRSPWSQAPTRSSVNGSHCNSGPC